MKKFLALTLAAAMALSMAACGGSGSSTAQGSSAAPAEESKTLTIWVEKLFSDEVNQYTEERVKQFGEENGYDVTCELINSTDFIPKLNAAIEGGADVPDVVYTDTTRTLNYYPNIPYRDVSDLVDEIDSERGYFDSMYESTKIDGVHYYVPYCSSAVIMFVRKDKLAEKGITEIPSTWDEVIEAARAVTDPDNDFYGLAMGCGETDDDDENTWRQWMWNEGAYMYDEEGNIVIEEGKWAEQLELIGQLYN